MHWSVLFLLCTLTVGPSARADKAQLEGVINLNTASVDELRLIPGVGPARVRNVMAYRRLHPFRTVDELARIKGIGRKMVRHWRAHLAVSGPSTAQRVVRPDMPFVGPPPVTAPSPSTARSPPTPTVPAKLHIVSMRGEPAHTIFPPATGNLCRGAP